MKNEAIVGMKPNIHQNTFVKCCISNLSYCENLISKKN